MCPAPRRVLNTSLAAATLRESPETNQTTTKRNEGRSRLAIGSQLFRSTTRLRFPSLHRIRNPIPRSNVSDKFYKEVLEGCLKDQDARDLFRSVLGQLITSIEPLTIRSLITLRQYDPYNKRGVVAVTGLLRRLGSLLSNVHSSNNNLPIIPLHTSFRDFLTNKRKSGDFYVSVRDAHNELAHCCLNLLLDPVYGLKFNICKLETSYLANDQVKDLNTRVDQHIPPALSYACHFWGDHLKHTDFKMDLFGKVEKFFKEKFLFWLEALSLTRTVGLAPSAFATLNMWLGSSLRVSITAGPTRNAITNLYSHNRISGGSLRNSGHSSMTPLYLYGISRSPSQKVHHISIFPLYHLRRPVLSSPHIIPPHFVESYMWNVENCLIGRH